MTIAPVDLFRRTAFAKAFEGASLTAIDIGSRGGFDRELQSIAWSVNCIGFEPEPEAFAALSTTAKPWRSLKWLPTAVGATTGGAILNVPPDGNGASLLTHDPVIGSRFGLEHLTQNSRPIAVETVTLDDAAARWALPPADYLKLDVEGAELSILQSAPRALAAALAIKAEASFVAARLNQPRVSDMEQFLRGQGFTLMDIQNPARWRRRPVAPHPYAWAGAPAYSRGQIAQCDLLFMRESAEDDVAGAMRAALLAMAFGFFDYAQGLFERPAVSEAVRRDWGIQIRPELAAASRRFGRHATWATIRHDLRNLVPLLRSLAGGIPS
jgi:FkbM family methyltransferase